jgi:hypothetical protein
LDWKTVEYAKVLTRFWSVSLALDKSIAIFIAGMCSMEKLSDIVLMLPANGTWEAEMSEFCSMVGICCPEACNEGEGSIDPSKEPKRFRSPNMF